MGRTQSSSCPADCRRQSEWHSYAGIAILYYILWDLRDCSHDGCRKKKRIWGTYFDRYAKEKTQKHNYYRNDIAWSDRGDMWSCRQQSGNLIFPLFPYSVER